MFVENTFYYYNSSDLLVLWWVVYLPFELEVHLHTLWNVVAPRTVTKVWWESASFVNPKSVSFSHVFIFVRLRHVTVSTHTRNVALDLLIIWFRYLSLAANRMVGLDDHLTLHLLALPHFATTSSDSPYYITDYLIELLWQLTNEYGWPGVVSRIAKQLQVSIVVLYYCCR